jgi:hypothetical protein
MAMAVTCADVAEAQGQLAQTTMEDNFSDEVTVDDRITNVDVKLIES